MDSVMSLQLHMLHLFTSVLDQNNKISWHQKLARVSPLSQRTVDRLELLSYLLLARLFTCVPAALESVIQVRL